MKDNNHLEMVFPHSSWQRAHSISSHLLKLGLIISSEIIPVNSRDPGIGEKKSTTSLIITIEKQKVEQVKQALMEMKKPVLAIQSYEVAHG